LGKVRPERVKKIAKELVKRYPAEFSTDFESNKKRLTTLATLRSRKLRNQIAGYITRLAAISGATGEGETGEAEEGDEEGEPETE
jgi:small subunit ribosomal protein S17e